LIFINFRALLDREGAWGIFYSVSSEEPINRISETLGRRGFEPNRGSKYRPVDRV
jgi:hypothetical protein